ncbi:MAG TPA: metallophosphoesterase [Nitrospirota bacterium]|nr:metallophosphoesterase [Nitrospirota bacterium]
MLNRKYFIVILLTGILTAFPVLAGQDQQIAQKLAALKNLPAKFSFVVLGDNRSGDEVYTKLIALAMERRPDLIVNTGDQIATPGNLDDWARFREMSKVVTVPYFLTVGNHDAHPKAPGSEKIYREQVELPGNELYYSFVAGNSLFIVLDSNLSGQEKKITGEQYTWLEDVLANAKQRHKFIFVHHPLYTDKGKGKHAGNSLDRYPRDRDRLQALFRKHGVSAVFSGHEHLYLRKVVDGIPSVITGGGGAPLYADDLNGGFYHYIYITVDGDKVNGEVVDINGKVRDKF